MGVYHLPYDHSSSVDALALLPHKSWMPAIELANMATQHSRSHRGCVQHSGNNHTLLVHGVWLDDGGRLVVDYLGALLPNPGLSLRM